MSLSRACLMTFVVGFAVCHVATADSLSDVVYPIVAEDLTTSGLGPVSRYSEDSSALKGADAQNLMLKSDTWLGRGQTPGAYHVIVTSSVLQKSGRFLGSWEQQVPVTLNADCAGQVESWLPNQEDRPAAAPSCLASAFAAQKSAIHDMVTSGLVDKLTAHKRASMEEYNKDRLLCTRDSGETLQLAAQDLDDYSGVTLGGMDDNGTRFINFSISGKMGKNGCVIHIDGRKQKNPLGNDSTEQGFFGLTQPLGKTQKSENFTFIDGKEHSIKCKFGARVYARLAECHFKSEIKPSSVKASSSKGPTVR